MKIDILQHVPFEGPAAIGEWARQNNHELRIHRLDRQEFVPQVNAIRFLILMGGPMSVNDSDQNWLEEERRLIRQAISLQVPIFGVCLGAQQIAKALGAEVSRGNKEVGWHPVETASERFSFIPERLTAFHWHGEQFDIPAGAERLFSSEACMNQGFVYNGNVIGLQFHLEATSESVRLLCTYDRDYIDASRYVQGAGEMMEFHIPRENKAVLFHLLDDLVEGSRT